jgi:hypothetical protein
MASTITASTLTTTVTESIFLNGTQQGGTSIKTFGSINEISKRILTITTNEVTIATFSAAVASTGHYNDSAVRYMRFTNKDDTNFITLTFTNEDNDEVAIKVDAGNSFIWAADNDGGMVDVFNATENAGVAASLADLRTIQADASASTIDLEMFIASV